MSNLVSVKQALELIEVSESSLRRDIKSGKVSSHKDARGRRLIDVSELTRVYGQLKPQNTHTEQVDENVRDSHLTAPDTAKIIALLEDQVSDLKEQLHTANSEKAQILKLLSLEKEEKRALMPPVKPKRNTGFGHGWFRRLFLNNE